VSASARWIVIGVGVFVVLGAGALVLVNTYGSTTVSERGPKTWLVQPGHTLRVPSDQVRIQDRFQCAGDGSPDMPKLWHPFAGSDLSSMAIDVEGNVTVHCVQDPPRNA